MRNQWEKLKEFTPWPLKNTVTIIMHESVITRLQRGILKSFMAEKMCILKCLELFSVMGDDGSILRRIDFDPPVKGLFKEHSLMVQMVFKSFWDGWISFTTPQGVNPAGLNILILSLIIIGEKFLKNWLLGRSCKETDPEWFNSGLENTPKWNKSILRSTQNVHNGKRNS